jgi:hypothetical protein
MFLGCFKSSPAITSRNISWATSVILVHIVSNNFYFKGFSISSKTGPSITVEMANFFYFVTFERRVLVPVTLYVSKRYFQRS